MRLHALKCFLSFTVAFSGNISLAQQRVIDYRFAPDYYHTPIGFVDDWQKTMVNEKGSLLYDFGPGPYVRANTIIGVGVKGMELKQKSQRLEHARIPIVITELSGSGVTLNVESFAIVPRSVYSAKNAAVKPAVHRRRGLNGALAWANPQGNVDPAFHNVAWGTNRPIVYEINVAKGSRKKVALGVCESYRTIPGQRMMEFHVEGAAVRTVDPLVSGVRNQPLVFFFKDAKDVNKDGRLVIETRPSAECRDPNVILSAVWVYSEKSDVTEEAIISGAATRQAEVFIDCGKEPEVQDLASRLDALLVTSDNKSVSAVITVQSPVNFRSIQSRVYSNTTADHLLPHAPRLLQRTRRKKDGSWSCHRGRTKQKSWLSMVTGFLKTLLKYLI